MHNYQTKGNLPLNEHNIALNNVSLMLRKKNLLRCRSKFTQIMEKDEGSQEHQIIYSS